MPNAVNALKRMAQSAVDKKVRLVTLNISSLLSEFACGLSDLDAKRVYRYSDFAASVDIVTKGLTRLSSLIESRASANDDTVKAQLDRVICGQSKITATDFISLGKSSLEVIQSIPARRRCVDVQGLNRLKRIVENAEKSLKDWPDYSKAQPGAAGDAPQAARP